MNRDLKTVLQVPLGRIPITLKILITLTITSTILEVGVKEEVVVVEVEVEVDRAVIWAGEAGRLPMSIVVVLMHLMLTAAVVAVAEVGVGDELDQEEVLSAAQPQIRPPILLLNHLHRKKAGVNRKLELRIHVFRDAI